MARREWRPPRDIERALESAGVAAKALAKHAVGLDTSVEDQRLDELAEEGLRALEERGGL